MGIDFSSSRGPRFKVLAVGEQLRYIRLPCGQRYGFNRFNLTGGAIEDSHLDQWSVCVLGL